MMNMGNSLKHAWQMESLGFYVAVGMMHAETFYWFA
jgi:hypothetical protein